MSNRPSELRDLAMGVFEAVASLELRLSEDDSDYGLTYIGQKLARCACYLEQLGDRSVELTRLSLEVTRFVSEHASIMRLKDRQFRLEPGYVTGDRTEKASWLQGKLEVFRSELEDWQMTQAYLQEIRGVVNDRIQLFKRLDSDIRLQHKLLEAKLAVGAGVGKGFPASPMGTPQELDIN